MEEAEVPLETVHEDLHHRARHGGESWTLGVALTAALLAAGLVFLLQGFLTQ